MFENAPEETRYIYTDFDSKEARLVGENHYSITFKKGELPPVNRLRSFAVYNKAHFFETNVLNHYSQGTKNKSLKYNSDGSLTFYYQHDSPGSDKESNWMPTPKFCLYIRSYWPKQRFSKVDGRRHR